MQIHVHLAGLGVTFKFCGKLNHVSFRLLCLDDTNSSLRREAAIHERVDSLIFAGFLSEFLLPYTKYGASTLVYSTYRLQNATVLVVCDREF